MKKSSWEKLKETLAKIEHQRWSDWQSWCHKVLRENCPSKKLEKVLKRWDKQIATPYSELSEKEKDSDRKQVDRYWELIAQELKREKKRVLNQAIAIFKKLPEGEILTKNPIILELNGLKKK